jgi:hypothetical protein
MQPIAQLHDSSQFVVRPYWSIIGEVARALGADWFSSGDRAELKRYEPGRRGAGEMVALRLLVSAGAPVVAMSGDEIQNWLALLRCMALLSGPNHDPHSTAFEANPGRVLFRIGYSESRLSLLLEARHQAFHELLLRAARMMMGHGERLNWSKIAPLVLAEDPERTWAENARLEIARDYFLAQAMLAA